MILFFFAVLKSPTGHGESVTKPELKTAHYLFCRVFVFGNFPVERLFFLLTSPPPHTSTVMLLIGYINLVWYE